MSSLITVERTSDGTVKNILMRRPSDFHQHLRQDAIMDAVIPEVLRPLKYVLTMPNTKPPLTTLSAVRNYRDRLLGKMKAHNLEHVCVVSTMYFSNLLTPDVIEHVSSQKLKVGIKAYPPHAGATTGSGFGVPILSLPDTLAMMEERGIPLLIHGESVFDKNGRELPHDKRETEFMREYFPRIRDQFPTLRICLEHISTSDGVKAVKKDKSGNTVCTITPHHPLLDHLFFKASWGNHLRCMPIPKNKKHMFAVREFMVSGDRRVILGSDCAPHLSRTKEGMPFNQVACGCYLPHAIAMYASIFAIEDALDDRFVNFASLNGPRWWGLSYPGPADTIRIRMETEHDIPDPTEVPEENDVIVPLGWTREVDRLKIGFALAEEYRN